MKKPTFPSAILQTHIWTTSGRRDSRRTAAGPSSAARQTKRDRFLLRLSSSKNDGIISYNLMKIKIYPKNSTLARTPGNAIPPERANPGRASGRQTTAGALKPSVQVAARNSAEPGSAIASQTTTIASQTTTAPSSAPSALFPDIAARFAFDCTASKKPQGSSQFVAATRVASRGSRQTARLATAAVCLVNINSSF